MSWSTWLWPGTPSSRPVMKWWSPPTSWSETGSTDLAPKWPETSQVPGSWRGVQTLSPSTIASTRNLNQIKWFNVMKWWFIFAWKLRIFLSPKFALKKWIEISWYFILVLKWVVVKIRCCCHLAAVQSDMNVTFYPWLFNCQRSYPKFRSSE